ncbi:LYR motif-containing protein 2-like [Littorina saxatilis]|uniref:LYR motif-containing protein 2 n=1 Tax=Littorina saxatilis TaxID=31220 RepID=A0AAN9GGN5_9CAEN
MASSGINGTLSLKRFLLRSEVLRLYRDMLRTLKRIPSQDQRKDLQQWIRTDFDNNKHHTEEAAIKMMITKGRMSLKELEQSLDLVT